MHYINPANQAPGVKTGHTLRINSSHRPFIDALWSPAGKGLTSMLSFVMSNCVFVTFHMWYPGSGVVLGCIDS